MRKLKFLMMMLFVMVFTSAQAQDTYKRINSVSEIEHEDQIVIFETWAHALTDWIGNQHFNYTDLWDEMKVDANTIKDTFNGSVNAQDRPTVFSFEKVPNTNYYYIKDLRTSNYIRIYQYADANGQSDFDEGGNPQVTGLSGAGYHYTWSVNDNPTDGSIEISMEITYQYNKGTQKKPNWISVTKKYYWDSTNQTINYYTINTSGTVAKLYLYKKVEVAPVEPATIHYTYTDSNDSNIQLTGSYTGKPEIDTPVDMETVTIPNYCDISNETWTENTDGSWNYTATVTANYLFRPSSDDAVYYYYVKADNENYDNNERDHRTAYWSASEDGTTVGYSVTADSDKEQWAFFGNWKDGFLIYNKNGNAIYNYDIPDAGNTTVAALTYTATIFNFNVGTFTNSIGKTKTYGEFKTGSHYLSFFSIAISNLAYYNASHHGSHFYFIEVESDTPEAPDYDHYINMLPVKRKMTPAGVDAWALNNTEITRGNGQEFLILTENGWWGLGEPTSGNEDNKLRSYPGPGNIGFGNDATGVYFDDVNTSGNLYSFQWTTDGRLYNTGIQQYLHIYVHGSSYRAEYTADSSQATEFNIEGTGTNVTIQVILEYVNGKPSFGAYLRSPLYEPNDVFWPSTTKGYVSLYTHQGAAEASIPASTPLSIRTEEGYATYYNATDAYRMPTGVTGYFIEGVDDTEEQESLTLTPRYPNGTIVPKQTALLLYNGGGKKDYNLELYVEDNTGTDEAFEYTDKDRNQIKGERDANGMTDAGDGVFYYKMTYKNGENLGFYWGAANGAAFKLTNPNTAYLIIDKELNLSGLALPTTFNDEITGIQAIAIEEEATPSSNDALYNLAGQRVEDSYRGIIIKNGKKYLNK